MTGPSVPIDSHPLPSALALSGLAAVLVGALVLAASPRPPAPPRVAPLPEQVGSILGPAAYRLPMLGQEDLDRSIAFYFQKLRSDPGAITHGLLAECYVAKARQSGDAHYFLLAEQSARESLAILPHDNERALLVLARVAEARHDFAGAQRLAADVLRSRPDRAEAEVIQLTCHQACGHLLEAQSLADRLVSRHPSAGILGLRAGVLLARGRDAAAAADLKRGLSLEEVGEREASARLRTLLGRAAVRRGASDLAEALYREALRIHPRYVPALVARAELARATGRTAEAEQDLLAADAQLPAPALAIAAARLRALRDPAGAAALSARAESDVRRELSSGGYGHRRDLAAILLDRAGPTDLPEAARLMEEEAALRRDAVTLELLARARLASGHPAAAEQAIAEALSQDPAAPELLVTAARVAHAAGDRARERERWAAALASHAPFRERPEARQILAAEAP